MSLETAIAALNVPTTPIQQQSLTKQEVTSAISESEAKTKDTGAQLIADATNNKSAVVDAKSAEATDTKTTETAKPEPISAKFSALAKKEKAIVTKSNELKAKEA